MHCALQIYALQTVHFAFLATDSGVCMAAFRNEVTVFDSRSSDSIALAIHFKAPILVGRDLLNSVGRVLGESKTEKL